MFLILAINTKFLVFKNMSYFFYQKKILKFDFLSLFCPVLSKISSKSQFLSYFDFKIIGNLFIPHFVYGIYIYPMCPSFIILFRGTNHAFVLFDIVPYVTNFVPFQGVMLCKNVPNLLKINIYYMF